MDSFLQAALEEARLSTEAGGVPIGSVLVVDGRIVGRGHNRQAALRSVIRHAELDCLDHAGFLPAADYRRAVLYTTLSPCEMCAGAILFFRIPRVVIGDNVNYRGAEEWLAACGVAVDVLNDPACITLLRDFDRDHPGVWLKGE
jgi:cytosine deaminase